MVLKQMMAATAAFCLVSGAAYAQMQRPEPVTVQPAATTFKLGALTVSSLTDGATLMPNNGMIFGVNTSPAEVAKVLAAAGAPTDKIRVDVDALLVRMPGHVVLLDTGNGPAGHGVLMQSLAQAGVNPGDVTDILITHAHNDHVGGLVDAQGAPAFAKATIHMSAKEWAFMQGNPRAKAIAAAIASQVKTFEPGEQVLPGIKTVALYGHTPGHTGYEITSNGRSLMDVGDIAHSPIISLAHPEWTIMFDGDKDAAVGVRRTELQRLAKTHELMFAPHFPYPGIGHVEAKDDGFAFLPEVPGSK